MWFNVIMIWLLRSPMHGFLSLNTMLIRVTGRKSGKTYTIPVNYAQEGRILTTTSFRKRTWWRNLRGGAPVTVHLRGVELPATAGVIEEASEVASELAALLRRQPNFARFYQVHLEANRQPHLEDVGRAAQSLVVIRTTLNG